MCRPDRDTAVRRKNVTAATRIMPPRAAKKPRSGKGFNWVCAKFLFGCADSRFGKPRISLWEGFNFVRAKPPLRRAESRFGKPRCSLQRERVVTFCVVQKVTKKHAGLRPATSIQSSAGEDFSKVFRQHESNPFFRTKRRRKGFESVRGSGVTA